MLQAMEFLISGIGAITSKLFEIDENWLELNFEVMAPIPEIQI
jgi:hypothetical protein